MKLFKPNTFFVEAILLIMLTTSPALAQSEDENPEVQQRRAGMMIQVSTPSEFEADSSMIRVIKSDSTAADVDISSLIEAGTMSGIKMYEISGDPREMVRRQMQQAMAEYEHDGPPVAVRTKAGQGSRVVVYVKNRTDQPLTNLSVRPDQMPEGWKSQPTGREINYLPAGHQQTVAFSLKAPDTQPRNVGFELKNEDGLTMGWVARVALPKSSTADKNPAAFEVHGNHPNPFNPTTTISYSLPQSMDVRLTVFNILGQRVATLVDSQQEACVQNVTWDASRVASGTYLYRVVARGANGQRFVSEKKMALIK
jgi:hypothetical protein